MASQRKVTRKKKQEEGTERTIKPKYQQEREDHVRVKPLVPMNKKQQMYMELLQDKSVVVATGFAGTSKTFLGAAMAADLYMLGKINKIIIIRPAISSSKTLGFFSGSVEEKMSVWLGGVIPVFKERMGKAKFEVALSCGDIEMVPLETIKGMSINDAWVLAEEASDLTKEEIIKVVTRMGKNSKLILSGDIRQSELSSKAGLMWFVDFMQRHNMQNEYGFVDFNEVSDIVRSSAVRQFITNLVKDEKRGQG